MIEYVEYVDHVKKFMAWFYRKNSLDDIFKYLFDIYWYLLITQNSHVHFLKCIHFFLNIINIWKKSSRKINKYMEKMENFFAPFETYGVWFDFLCLILVNTTWSFYSNYPN